MGGGNECEWATRSSEGQVPLSSMFSVYPLDSVLLCELFGVLSSKKGQKREKKLICFVMKQVTVKGALFSGLLIHQYDL